VGNRSYEDLRVWQEAMNLAKDVYRDTRKLPKEELYGLTQQLRRSAVSVPSNIAEGCGRNTNVEFLQFLGIASGSLAELKTQLLIMKDVFDLNKDSEILIQKANEVGKMLAGLKRSIYEQRATSN